MDSTDHFFAASGLKELGSNQSGLKFVHLFNDFEFRLFEVFQDCVAPYSLSKHPLPFFLPQPNN